MRGHAATEHRAEVLFHPPAWMRRTGLGQAQHAAPAQQADQREAQEDGRDRGDAQAQHRQTRHDIRPRQHAEALVGIAREVALVAGRIPALPQGGRRDQQQVEQERAKRCAEVHEGVDAERDRRKQQADHHRDIHLARQLVGATALLRQRGDPVGEQRGGAKAGMHEDGHRIGRHGVLRMCGATLPAATAPIRCRWSSRRGAGSHFVSATS